MRVPGGVGRVGSRAPRAGPARTRPRSSAAFPDPPRGRIEPLDLGDPPLGASWREPLVRDEPGEPREDRARVDGCRCEDVVRLVPAARGQPVGEQDGEERHEARPEEEQERAEARELEQERAERPDRRGEHDQRGLRSTGQQVLQGHRARVGVREGLVRLGDRERQQGEERHEPTGGDGGRKRRGVGDVAGEEHDGPEREEQHVRHEVPDARSEEGGAGRSREARVVGCERDPRDRHADDDVDPLPRRETALAGTVPRIRETSARQRPPDEVGDGERHDPHGDPPDHGADDADRAEQAEPERGGAEEERPGPARLEAEDLLGEGGCGGGNHE